jgi:hypothetical protein
VNFQKAVNEFEMAGFTMEPAIAVKPPMVKESKIKLECRVNEVKPLGTEGGAGNLVIAEVLYMHIDDAVLNEEGKIDQTKLSLVARLGGDWYCQINESNLFKVNKPNTQLGIGFTALPASIRASNILTGNHLGMLANLQEIPLVNPAYEDDTLKHIIHYYAINPIEMEKELHLHAKKLLDENKVEDAWQVLLSSTL